MMIMINDDDDDNGATHDSSCQSRPGPDALTWIQAKLGKEGFCKRSFLSLVYPHKTMAAQARYMVDQGNCPCLTSGRSAKDSVAQTQIPAARMTWALRDSEGYLTDSASHCTVLLIEAIFSSTANSRLPFTLMSLTLKKL